jgi:gamma-glutamylcyclotransferase (GGCT)/AIG2-like uncharacterized protein YtfP
MNTTELLFSYGTLQNIEVQLATFGRELDGCAEQLLGYKLAMLQIKDLAVVELSGATLHPIAVVSNDENDFIDGVVFKITAEELAQSDKYEVDDYQRVEGVFKSGKKAWVYVQA